jgi:hypothetical protein
MNDHHEVWRGLSDRHSKASDVFGQTRLGDSDAVLDQYLRLIDVYSRLEDDVDRNPPVAGQLRDDVEHVVNTVDLLLNRCRHGCRDDFGRGARICSADIHGRRRDLWIFRDRQGSLRDGASDCQKDREDGGENRPVDKEMGKSHPLSLARDRFAQFETAVITPSWGATKAPGRTNGLAMPSITILSF